MRLPSEEMSESDTPDRVLIVGGGVAGLEGALALRELARERVQTTLLSPESEFVYRPMRVREPFGLSEARRYPLEELTRDIGVELVTGSLRWIEPTSSTSTRRMAPTFPTTRFCWPWARACVPPLRMG